MTTCWAILRFLAEFLGRRLAVAVGALALAATGQAVASSAPPPVRAVISLPERTPIAAQASSALKSSSPGDRPLRPIGRIDSLTRR